MERTRDKSENDNPLIAVAIIVSPTLPAADAVDAIVEEQDCSLLLQVRDSVPVAESKPAWYLANLLDQQPQLQPGTARLLAGGRPRRIQAIVYDIDQEPNCRPQWVAMALQEILAIAQVRGWRSIALPMLGARHGRLPAEVFLTLLAQAIAASGAASLQTVWLLHVNEE